MSHSRAHRTPHVRLRCSLFKYLIAGGLHTQNSTCIEILQKQDCLGYTIEMCLLFYFGESENLHCPTLNLANSTAGNPTCLLGVIALNHPNSVGQAKDNLGVGPPLNVFDHNSRSLNQYSLCFRIIKVTLQNNWLLLSCSLYKAKCTSTNDKVLINAAYLL